MNHAKTSCSTEIFAGAIISVVQYLAPLRYCIMSHALCLHRSWIVLMVLKYIRCVQIPIRRHERVWSQATLDHVKVFFEHVRCIDTQRQKGVQVGAFLMCIVTETVLAGHTRSLAKYCTGWIKRWKYNCQSTLKMLDLMRMLHTFLFGGLNPVRCNNFKV
jgi:hypothetical protein